ncbi:white collar 2 type of transcription factor [Mycena floridula]|nr:white collar 2 type of transcription factor [Mycena floridula]
MQAASTSSGPSHFEFTKRKRWGDLLVAELADCIMFVLSPTGKVLFVGNAITDLLGWPSGQLVDSQFLDLVSHDDQPLFHRTFEDSIRTRLDLITHVRLKYHNLRPSAQSKSLLFEIKGHAHFMSQDECACFFAAATPFESRNTSGINALLELKIENERLQQRLRDLKDSKALASMNDLQQSQAAMRNVAHSYHNPAFFSPTNQQPYRSSSLILNDQISGTGTQAPSSTYYPQRTNQFNSAPFTFGTDATATPSLGNPFISSPTLSNSDEDEETRKKKKLKKSGSGVEQYVCVTCGRTDSPEWRKGPSGPKTLCNACGLRWAKQTRKPNGEVGQSPENGERG